MRQLEIELAESLDKLTDPTLRDLFALATRKLNEKLQGVDLTDVAAADMEQITNQCYLEITGRHWDL